MVVRSRDTEATARTPNRLAPPPRADQGASSGRDGTEGHRVEHALALLQRLIPAVAATPDLTTALQLTVSHVCEATGWELGQAWVPSSDGTVLECTEAWHVRGTTHDASVTRFRRASTQLIVGFGHGLPGRAWRLGQPVWAEDVSGFSDFARAAEAEAVGFTAGVAIPVLAGDVAAVLEFFVRNRADADPSVVEVVSTVATCVGSLVLQKRAESALRESEVRYRSLAQSANEAIVTADQDGIIIGWDGTAAATFGYEADEAIGRPLSILIPERFRAAHDAALTRAGDCPHPTLAGKPVEWVALRRDGLEFPVEVSLSTWTTDAGRFFTGIIRDATDRKRTEAGLAKYASDLERSNRDLEEFAYVASHDLHEPLRVVKGYLQLIASRYEGKLDADADEFIAYAVGGADRMAQLIDDLLTYSRAGRLDMDLAPIDLGEVATAAWSWVGAAAGDANAQLIIDDLPTVHADARSLEQVLQNLFANAVKFCPPETAPRVEVTARRDGESWRVEVTDNGIGVPAADTERVFGMFKRVHGRSRYPGSGIGLAVCRKIVERHGGEIWVEPVEGGGSRFVFTLPARGGERW